MVYGIIQRHGGMIEIDSEKGKGTTFSFVIPATQIEAVEAGETETPLVDRALSVLVVDDQEIICELIAAHLMSDGHQPVVSSDAIAAQKQFESGTFDLLITDQSMPGLSGEQLATNVKKSKPGTKVIMLTGFGDDVMANGGLPQGVDRVLSKPVSCDDLRRAIFEVAN